ncbi:hypothetical protein U1Q18_008917 [Sarracenia purpurea var. burkii]
MMDRRADSDVDHTGDGSRGLERTSGEGLDILHRRPQPFTKATAANGAAPFHKIPDLPPISSATLESRDKHAAQRRNSSKSKTPAIASSEKVKLISSTIRKAAKKGEKTERQSQVTPLSPTAAMEKSSEPKPRSEYL